MLVTMAQPPRVMTVGFCVVLLALAGCGAAPGARGGQVTPSPALNGCPIKRPPANGSPQADVVLTQGGNDLNPVTSTLAVGQIVGVHLSASVNWNLTQSDNGADLHAIDPSGYYSDPDHMCIWNFTAAAPGVVQAHFSGGILCPPGAFCPAIAAVADFTITVHTGP